MQRSELTFEVNLRDDQVLVSYYQDGRPLMGSNGVAIGPANGPMPPVLSSVRDVFSRGDWDALQTQLGTTGQVEIGHALTQLLFPDQDRASEILKAAVADGSTAVLAPDARSIRARVVTTDAGLSGLPWRLARWKATRLAGSVSRWTFEVAREVVGGHVVQFPSPPRILVVAPRAGAVELPTDEHVARLHQRLRGHSSRYDDQPDWQVARTQKEIWSAAQYRPDLVYYFGHGQREGDRPCAVLEDGLFPFDELLSLFESPPHGLYLNGCWSGGLGWWQIGPSLGARVPLVLTQPTVAWSERAGDQALEWMDGVIGEGVDPIEALHRTARGSASLVFEASVLAAHTHFKQWTAGRPLGRRAAPVHARLDRLKQRQPTVDEVDRVMELGRRLAVIVGHGTPENHPERLQELLQGHLDKKLGRRAQLRWRPVRLRPDRPLTHAALDAALRDALNVAHGVSLGEAIRVACQPATGGLQRLLMLQWGDYPLVTGDSALSEDDLECWLSFHRDLGIADSFPTELRVVAFLTLVTPYSDGVKSQVEDFEADHGVTGHVRFVPLPPLVSVPRSELIDHLRDETRAPNELAPQLATLLLSMSKDGTYDQLVPLIEAAERDNWFQLSRQCKPRRKGYYPVPS